jgi:hypothetical protein
VARAKLLWLGVVCSKTCTAFTVASQTQLHTIAGLDWSYQDEEATERALKAMLGCRSPFKCALRPVLA